MPSVQLLPRDDSSNTLNPVYIAGFAVIGAVVLGLALWFAIRIKRKRAQEKREEDRGAAFLSVKGIVKDEEKSATALQGSTFSRNQLDSSVVLPDKVLLPPPTHAEIIAQHRESGNFPRPFAPFSFALSAANAPTHRSTPSDGSSSDKRNSSFSLNLPMFRNSMMSVSSSYSTNRFSVMSTASSNASSTTGHARKVRQLFTPVLPDELLVTSLGERLTIVQSFDDGWCVVGRESSLPSVFNAQSLFKSNTPPTAPDVELGVVPAWCFLKPVKGLRAERPVRSTSLGITVQMDGPGVASRGELMSWSNF